MLKHLGASKSKCLQTHTHIRILAFLTCMTHSTSGRVVWDEVTGGSSTKM